MYMYMYVHTSFDTLCREEVVAMLTEWCAWTLSVSKVLEAWKFVVAVVNWYWIINFGEKSSFGCVYIHFLAETQQ